MAESRRRRRAPREVFLSHASTDRRFASRLAEALRRRGIPVWYSRTHIRGAHQWHDEIGKALARCDWFIVVLSPSSVVSPWVKSELLNAFSRAFSGPQYSNRIVPVVYRPCDTDKLTWLLRPIQQVDFSRSFAAGLRELLLVWGIKSEDH
jgi:hypothetical protein